MKSEEKGATPKLHVAVVGSINVDYLASVDRLPAPGETVAGRESHVVPGGKGANQAVAAARLGTDVVLIGSVGQDPNAALALQLLRDSGVDVSGIGATEGATGTAFVTVDSNGENTIVVIPGANAVTDREAILRHRDAIANAGILVVQGEIPRTGTEAAVALATGRVILNLAPVIHVALETIKAADPLVVNEHEAALVLHQLNPDHPIPADHAELLSVLAAVGPRSVIMTRGSLGAMYTEDGKVESVPAPRVEVVDTTGAGDAFVGALAAALAVGSTLGKAVEFASRVGAYSVQRSGTQASYPTAADALPVVTL
ncbi:ribokinase [Pseudarthrobacter sp. YS3]|uniref:ribokinase n=1 Tax=Pseudarthrobacter sp. YS3 TaxID=3453718 RepID=UPI003EE8D1A0